MQNSKGFLVVLACFCFLGFTRGTPNTTFKIGLKAYFDIRIGGEYQGRIVFGLYNWTCPRTVRNFQELCDSTNGYGYPGSNFHRTIKNFMIQGGDFLSGDGYGFKSIYGQHFDDENFIIKNHIMMLGMANRGPNTNGCQIYINVAPTPWLDNKHVVFGRVLSGWDVVRMIENNPTGANDRPIKDVIISHSGTFSVPEPYVVNY